MSRVSPDLYIYIFFLYRFYACYTSLVLLLSCFVYGEEGGVDLNWRQINFHVVEELCMVDWRIDVSFEQYTFR